MLQHAPEV